MSLKKKELLEGMVISDDTGDWYVAMVEEDGSVWIEPQHDCGKRSTTAIEIHSDRDLKGFRIVCL